MDIIRHHLFGAVRQQATNDVKTGPAESEKSYPHWRAPIRFIVKFAKM
jgi:hypothetical protein